MASAAKNQLQGPRPQPLTVNRASTKIFKTSSFPPNRRDRRSPVIIYLRSPKIIHVRPEDFQSFVQRLTGLRSTKFASVASSLAGGEEFPAAVMVDAAADPPSFGYFQSFVYS